jgi:hypothetical protein
MAKYTEPATGLGKGMAFSELGYWGGVPIPHHRALSYKGSSQQILSRHPRRGGFFFFYRLSNETERIQSPPKSPAI